MYDENETNILNIFSKKKNFVSYKLNIFIQDTFTNTT